MTGGCWVWWGDGRGFSVVGSWQGGWVWWRMGGVNCGWMMEGSWGDGTGFGVVRDGGMCFYFTSYNFSSY